MPNVLLNRFWIWPVTLGLLATALVASWLGLQDVVWPVSLSAQLLGLFFTVAGLLGLISVLLLLRRAVLLRHRRPAAGWLWVGPDRGAVPPGRWHRPERRPEPKAAGPAQIALMAAGAVAGMYVDVTIVAYSFRYDIAEAGLFTGFGLLCLGLAWRTLPAAWPQVGQYLKGVGISVTVLGAAAGFWFQSFYLPENTQIGIQYGLTVVSVRHLGTSRLVTLDLTMENQSSVTALAVGSMLEVFGLSYTKTGRAEADAGTREDLQNDLKNLNLYGITANAAPNVDLPPNSSTIATPRDLSIGSGEQQQSMPLALIRPVNDDSLLFPDDISSRDFVVTVPEPAVRALDVQIRVQYARTTRLALGYPVDTHLRPRACSYDKRAAWYVSQSALLRFTRGGQIFYSDWCADLNTPFIDWGIRAARGTHDSGGAVSAITSHLGIITGSRDEMFTLP